MAKKQITPQLFRAGITQHWPTSIKLENYLINFTQLDASQRQITEYWYNKILRKLLLKRSFLVQRKKFRKSRKWYVRRAFLKRWRKRSFLQILKKSIEMRRRVLLFRVVGGRVRSGRRRRRVRGLYQRVNYWYSRKVDFRKQKKWGKSLRRFVRNEKRLLWFRNYANLTFLNLQAGLDYYVRFSMEDARTSLGGSTTLRRYQYNISAVQPPRWTGYIKLRPASFKKIVGYILAHPKKPRINRQYLVILSQINLALHWRSSELFIHLIKNMLEQRRRVQGALRLIHELLNRLHLARFNILCLKMKITGSFGKLTRSKSIRLGRIGAEIPHSLTNINQSVSYSYSQVWTIRGVLGLRVWIFW